VITLALWLALAGAPAPEAAADNPHFDEAVAAWKESRWPEAADAFARAYELDPRPQYVFARAQALRFAGDCEPAIVHYREFIALAPPQAAITEARGHIATCGGDADDGTTADTTTTDSTSPAPRVEPTPAVDPPSEPPPRRRWWRDPTGHALGWTGLAAAAVGAGLLGEGLARRQRGERADDEQAYRDARRGGATLLHAGIPLLSIGGALVLASVIRFAVVGSGRTKRDRARKTALVQHGVVPFGLGIAWSP
jgi:tetratricopeptide (TPR) repeat protein